MTSQRSPTERTSATRTRTRVDTCHLRWKCDPAVHEIPSTRDVAAIRGVVGQDDAIEALTYGLETSSPGMNVYVGGLTGTGRMKLVRHLLEEVRPACKPAADRAYVRNFESPDRPNLITLPRGRGREFRDRIDGLARYIREELVPALTSEEMDTRRTSMERDLQAELLRIGAPFEKELAENDLALVTVQTPSGAQPAIVPLVEGQPTPPDQVQQLVADGKLSEEDLDRLRERVVESGERFSSVNDKMRRLREQHHQRVREMIEAEARQLMESSVCEIRETFPGPEIERFLEGIVDDVVERQLGPLGEGRDPSNLYQVNLILEHREDDDCPILVETQPSLANLLGVVERHLTANGSAVSNHTMIRAGSILLADGGYLIIEAREVLSEPGAWRALMRTLRTGRLEVSASESLLFGAGTAIKPEPIPIDVKIVLIGDPGLYHLLDANDPDFPELFKVLADFDTSVPRDEEALRFYAGVLARMVAEEELPHFESDAVAALAEHGARIAGRNDRLTTRFGRLADLAREAAYLARRDGRESISAPDVKQAVRRSRRRGDLPARRFREAIADGTIRVQTSGGVIGQVNGLAVTRAGPLTYGFPARITATIGPGHAGTINIEGVANLSGAIHTKGFYILGGLLRFLMRGSGHPLAFSASIAFEQSYGGIDGDSASGAEICCLLSALTDVPLAQSVAMTGAIDQHGHVQPIGAASEKIEGFFDTCSSAGLRGDQGVIIPAGNRRDLVLREDVVEACGEGRFHVWTVETIGEALEIFTGREAGDLDAEGRYPEGSLLALAVERAEEFWRMAREGSGSA